MSRTYTTTIHGDTLSVLRTESGMCMAPADGTQHLGPDDAMRAEIEAYMVSCGEDLDSELVQADITSYVSAMTEAQAD